MLCAPYFLLPLPPSVFLIFHSSSSFRVHVQVSLALLYSFTVQWIPSEVDFCWTEVVNYRACLRKIDCNKRLVLEMLVFVGNRSCGSCSFAGQTFTKKQKERGTALSGTNSLNEELIIAQDWFVRVNSTVCTHCLWSCTSSAFDDGSWSCTYYIISSWRCADASVALGGKQ